MSWQQLVPSTARHSHPLLVKCSGDAEACAEISCPVATPFSFLQLYTKLRLCHRPLRRCQIASSIVHAWWQRNEENKSFSLSNQLSWKTNIDSNKGKTWNMVRPYTVSQCFVISYLPICILILKVGNVYFPFILSFTVPGVQGTGHSVILGWWFWSREATRWQATAR